MKNLRKSFSLTGIILLLIFTPFITVKSVVFEPTDKNVITLNGNWDFYITFEEDTSFHNNFYRKDFKSNLWQTIPVPSNWELMGFEEPTYFYPEKNVIGYYRKEVEINEALSDKQLFLHFEGVAFAYELYVNGKNAGKFESAFNHAQFDITQYIGEEETNLTIALKVTRSHKHLAFDCNDDWALSGIYRDVYLIGMPDTYIDNFDIQTLVQKDGNASIAGNIAISHIPVKAKENMTTPELMVIINLKDADGNIIAKEQVDVDWDKYEIMPDAGFQLTVNEPHLWNAEHPYLYTIEMELRRDGEVIQNISDKIGIRTISVDRNGLKINGKNIKIRGVCRHEIQPERGRALREQDWVQDIKLMKEANINAVRCSHYPPHPRFLELCDEYGFYVVNEVPFGFGEKILDDPDILGELLARAKHTLERDKNHPSVIIWSIGNENPVTENVKAVAQYVKLMDPSRPILFPHNNFSWEKFGQSTGLPAFTDIYGNHYSNAEKIEDFAKSDKFDIPFLFTEYNHSLDEAFGALQRKWDVIYRYDNLIGGYIWLWADQGLYRGTAGKEVYNSNDSIHVLKGKNSALSADFWISEDTIMDSHGVYGTDGIVRANRFPQTDYWETRKVYSPVKIAENKLMVKPGNQEVTLSVTNYYNFTNLNKTAIKWNLLRIDKIVDKSSFLLDIPPGDTQNINLSLEIPSDINEVPYFLEIYVTDWNDIAVYEHAISFNEATFKDLESYHVNDSFTLVEPTVLVGTSYEEVISVNDNTLNVSIDEEHLLSLKVNDITLLDEIGLRVTRNLTMAEQKTYEDRNDPKFSFGVLGATLNNLGKTFEGENTIISANVTYTLTGHPEASVNVLYNFVTGKQSGKIDVLYQISSENYKGYFPELGIDFYLPTEFTQISWLGNGPYPAYPEKSALVSPGFYTINTSYPYFEGNRNNTSLAIAQNKNKQGIVFLGNNENISFSQNDDNVIVSHNLLVAGLGSKFKFPITHYKASELGTQQGRISIIPVFLLEKEVKEALTK